jgi:DNA repair exonuclease SbcCD nuclease subunit
VLIAALGDAHLGRSYLPVTENGVNVREQDFEKSFAAAVDLALAQNPDVVVWLGDIFDQPRPTYRSFRRAQAAMRRIREHGTRLVAISGNHDTPRLPGTGSPYSVLADAFPDFHFAHRYAYERFELPGLVVHAVPQMQTVQQTLEALDEVERNRSLDCTNLLLTHPRVTSVEPGKADTNEIEIDDTSLRSDLVLLGHYHFHTPVGPNMWYAGSTDCFTFSDKPERPKGIVTLDTQTGECRHVPLTGRRELVTLPRVEALGLSPDEVQRLVLERAASVPEGAVARLELYGVEPEAYRLLDLAVVHDAAKAALHLKLQPEFAGVTKRIQLTTMDSIGTQWDAYLKEQDLPGFDRERMKTLGQHYLDQAVEEQQA